MIRAASRLVPLILLATFVSARQIQVRMNSRLSSETTPAGSSFAGVLVNPVHIQRMDCPKGSPVGGVVTESKRSGRLSSPGKLQMQPTWISCRGRRLPVSAEPVVLEGRSHTKRNVVLIGGGAGAGAILGGIMGGGKGAVIGSAVGAGAGTVGAAATGRHEAVIEAESVVAWNLQAGRPVQNRDNRSPQMSSYRHPDAAHPRHDDDDDDDRDDRREGERSSRHVRFTEHDRVYLSRCLVSNYRLPPGLAKQGKIPPGHARKMQRAGYTAIPYACTAELSPGMEGESKQSSSSPVRRGFTNNIYQQYLPGISYLASEQPVKAAIAIQHNRGEARIYTARLNPLKAKLTAFAWKSPPLLATALSLPATYLSGHRHVCSWQLRPIALRQAT